MRGRAHTIGRLSRYALDHDEFGSFACIDAVGHFIHPRANQKDSEFFGSLPFGEAGAPHDGLELVANAAIPHADTHFVAHYFRGDLDAIAVGTVLDAVGAGLGDGQFYILDFID
jgi:hypothetical protein